MVRATWQLFSELFLVYLIQCLMLTSVRWHSKSVYYYSGFVWFVCTFTQSVRQAEQPNSVQLWTSNMRHQDVSNVITLMTLLTSWSFCQSHTVQHVVILLTGSIVQCCVYRSLILLHVRWSVINATQMSLGCTEIKQNIARQHSCRILLMHCCRKLHCY